MVEDRVEGDGDEVDHVELDHGTQPGHGGAGGGTEERRLTDRRGQNAVSAETGKLLPSWCSTYC